MIDKREGGCLCGQVRYEIDLTDYKMAACHCIQCRKQAGAPVVWYTGVPNDQFCWISRPDGSFSISEQAIRHFCSNCGSFLSWEMREPDGITSITTGTLDDPSGLLPTVEIYVKDRIEGMPPLPCRQIESE